MTEKARRAIEEAREEGASSWLSALPLEELGFVLDKGEFRDALRPRYARELRELSSQCRCGQQHNVNQTLNWKRGWSVIIRHNNIRHFETNLIKHVQSDVEPRLQPISGKNINDLTGDYARPNIRARSVFLSKHWCKLSESYITGQYSNHIMNIQHGILMPLVLSLSGSVGNECFMLHKHMPQKITNKTGERYQKIMSIIRCKLSFLSRQSCSLCIRGRRLLQKSEFADNFGTTCLSDVCELSNSKDEEHSF